MAPHSAVWRDFSKKSIAEVDAHCVSLKDAKTALN